jgi:hypothetical protein
MRIGRYNITVTKENVKTFTRPYLIWLTGSLVFFSNRSSMEHLKFSIIYATIPFLVEVVFENYCKNNLHKRKDNWFWSGYEKQIK